MGTIFDERRMRTEPPSFGPGVMLNMGMVFEQICMDNNISPTDIEQRGAVALAIFRAVAKRQDLAELRDAEVTLHAIPH